jgi:hypothetical protein
MDGSAAGRLALCLVVMMRAASAVRLRVVQTSYMQSPTEQSTKHSVGLWTAVMLSA